MICTYNMYMLQNVLQTEAKPTFESFALNLCRLRDFIASHNLRDKLQSSTSLQWKSGLRSSTGLKVRIDKNQPKNLLSVKGAMYIDIHLFFHMYATLAQWLPTYIRKHCTYMYMYLVLICNSQFHFLSTFLLHY
jgi:hypothetical protein